MKVFKFIKKTEKTDKKDKKDKKNDKKKGLRSIKSQLRLIIILLVLVVSFSVGVLSYITSRNEVMSQVEEALKISAQQGGKLIESRIKTEIAFLETLANQAFITDNTDINKRMEFLHKESKRVGYQTIAIANQSGHAYQSDGLEVDVSRYDYFKNAIKGESCVSDVIINTTTKEAIVVVAVPIIERNKTTGVLYGVRTAQEFNEMILDIVYGKSGYAYVINGKGTVQLHKDIEKALNLENVIENAGQDSDLKELAAIEAKMIEGKSGVEQYSYKGENRIVGYAPIPGTDWYIGVNASVDEAVHGVYYLRNIIFGFSLIVAVAGFIISLFIGNAVANPMIAGTDIAAEMAKGNFTSEFNAKILKRKDEVGRLFNAFKTMQENLRELISQNMTAAENVSATSEQLSASIEEISSNAHNQASLIEEVSGSMEEMSANIQIVRENMQTTAKEMDVIANNAEEIETLSNENAKDLEEINKSIENILEAINNARSSIEVITDESGVASREADETVALAGEGKNNLDKTVKQMENIQETILNLSEVINGLGESAEQIGEITGLIKDVAEQTNLLALNASIEAARAGEHGKGFAVVAQAIGKLAEESQNATKEITLVIKNIQSEIAKAIENSKKGTMVVQSGTHLVQQTSDSLLRIFSAIQNTSKIIKNISGRMEDQSEQMVKVHDAANEIDRKVSSLMASMQEGTAASSEIRAKIDTINEFIGRITVSMEEQSSASEQVSSAVNENAAGIGEISASSEDIAKSAQELAQSAQNLLEMTKRFKI